MEFTILGSGALGGYYGGMIARNGDTVRFITRRDTEALRANGLRVESQHGDIHIENPEIYGTDDTPPPSDVVLVCCKTTALQDVLDRIPNLLKPGGIVMTLQNGLGVENPLRKYVDDDHLLSGVCFLCSERSDAGIIKQRAFDRITMGYYSSFGHVKATRILAHFHHGGIDAVLSKNIAQMRWQKLLWNIPFSGLATRYDLTVDQVLAQHPCMVRKLMSEVLTAGMCLTGWKPKEDIIDDRIAKTHKMGDYAPAMLLDRRAGRTLEWQTMFAEPLRRADAAGIPMPAVRELCDAIAPLPQND